MGHRALFLPLLQGRSVQVFRRQGPYRSGSARALMLAAVAMGVLSGLGSLRFAIESLGPDLVYSKEFVQDYLLARAIIEGTDPYVPVQVLARQYLAKSVGPSYPTPHPPPTGVLLAPLGLLDYQVAASLWFGLETVAVAASVYLLACGAGRRTPLWTRPVACLAVMGWYPFMDDLLLGQLMVVLLVLLAGARLAILSGRPGLGGILVGLAVLVKPVPWPLLLLFALQKRWRALVGATAVILPGYVASVMVLGQDRVIRYFTQVLPQVTEINKAYAENLSLWTIGWRIFSGTRSIHPQSGVVAPPLWESDGAAVMASVSLPALALLLALLAASRQRDFDTSLGLLVCSSILVSPTSWHYYLVLAVIPAAHGLRWLIEHHLPPIETGLAALVTTLLLVPGGQWAKLAYSVAGHPVALSQERYVPFFLSLLTLVPSLAVAALALLVMAIGAITGTRGDQRPRSC